MHLVCLGLRDENLLVRNVAPTPWPVAKRTHYFESTSRNSYYELYYR